MRRGERYSERTDSLPLLAGEGVRPHPSIPAPQAGRGSMRLPSPACGGRAGVRGLTPPRKQGGEACDSLPLLAGEGLGLGVLAQALSKTASGNSPLAVPTLKLYRSDA
jgi:hypothetical protein